MVFTATAYSGIIHDSGFFWSIMQSAQRVQALAGSILMIHELVQIPSPHTDQRVQLPGMKIQDIDLSSALGTLAYIRSPMYDSSAWKRWVGDDDVSMAASLKRALYQPLPLVYESSTDPWFIFMYRLVSKAAYLRRISLPSVEKLPWLRDDHWSPSQCSLEAFVLIAGVLRAVHGLANMRESSTKPLVVLVSPSLVKQESQLWTALQDLLADDADLGASIRFQVNSD